MRHEAWTSPTLRRPGTEPGQHTHLGGQFQPAGLTHAVAPGERVTVCGQPTIGLIRLRHGWEAVAAEAERCPECQSAVA